MDKDLRVLTFGDLEPILELNRSQFSGEDELADSMKEWHARWRRESLEFYLEKAWSFGYFVESQTGKLELSAYFLAQPILFFRTMTQTLWIEHCYFNNSQEIQQLMEVAYKLSREKHLQRLVFDDPRLLEYVKAYKHNKLNENFYEVLTTKA